MGLPSLQVCMDSSHWLEGTLQDDSSGGMDSSSSPSGDHHHHMLGCSRPIMDRRLRPQHDQPLKCPRYWTKGGTLRNIPVGGGCRKNKKAASSKRPTLGHAVPIHNQGSSSRLNPTVDLHLSLPHNLQLSSAHFTGSLLETGPFSSMNNFLAGPDVFNIDGNNPSRGNYDIMVGDSNPPEQVQLGVLGAGGFGDLSTTGFGPSIHGLCSNYGVISSPTDVLPNTNNSFGAHFMENNNYQSAIPMDLKPNPRLLSLDWQEHDSSEAEKGNINPTFGGYGFNGLGSSWAGMVINEYGSSTANPLV
ncbi:hypothetical protein SAY86_009368 [Trapa natans]|uniref:Dof-type domain-containing protein n=1 Tax=Trapa natans TaxID=22666 RepID=A0AAN7KQV2_TRANT|nr:hypothetical protein SAY86_009368 [Trapa natans]